MDGEFITKCTGQRGSLFIPIRKPQPSVLNLSPSLPGVMAINVQDQKHLAMFR